MVAALGDKTPMGDAFEHAVLHYLGHDPVVGFKQAWLRMTGPTASTSGSKARPGHRHRRHRWRGQARRGPGEVPLGPRAQCHPDARWPRSSASAATSSTAGGSSPTPSGGQPTPRRPPPAAVTSPGSTAMPSSTATSTGRPPSMRSAARLARPWNAASPREPDQTAAIADTLEALKKHERVAAHHGLRDRQDARHPLDHRGPQGPPRPRPGADTAAAQAVPHAVARARHARLHRSRRLLRCGHDGPRRVDRPSRRARRAGHDRPRRHRHVPEGRGSPRRLRHVCQLGPHRRGPGRPPDAPRSTSSWPTRPTASRVSPAVATPRSATPVVLDGERIRARRRLFATATPTGVRQGDPHPVRGPRGCRVRLDGRCRALRRRGPPTLVPARGRARAARGLPALGRRRHRCRGRAARS